MIILDSTAVGAIAVVLGEAHSVSGVGFFFNYKTVNPDIPSVKQTTLGVTSNGTTPVTLLAVPATPIWYEIARIAVNNTDNIAHNVTVAYGFFRVFNATLLANERAEYNDKEGWRVFDINGALKLAYTDTRRSIAFLSADVTNNNGVANTIANVTGLEFPVAAGKRYRFKFVIDYTAAATSTGSRWSVNGPAATRLAYDSDYALTTTTVTQNRSLNAYDLPAASNATSASTTGNLAIIEGFITPSASGNVIARFASEVASSAIVAKAGSYVEYEEV